MKRKRERITPGLREEVDTPFVSGMGSSVPEVVRLPRGSG